MQYCSWLRFCFSSLGTEKTSAMSTAFAESACVAWGGNASARAAWRQAQPVPREILSRTIACCGRFATRRGGRHGEADANASTQTCGQRRTRCTRERQSVTAQAPGRPLECCGGAFSCAVRQPSTAEAVHNASQRVSPHLALRLCQAVVSKQLSRRTDFVLVLARVQASRSASASGHYSRVWNGIECSTITV